MKYSNEYVIPRINVLEIKDINLLQDVSPGGTQVVTPNNPEVVEEGDPGGAAAKPSPFSEADGSSVWD